MGKQATSRMASRPPARLRTATRNAGTTPDDGVGIFISYSTENESLARKLKDKLEGLENTVKLDVFIAAELGGQPWRKTIREKLEKARILILPYTSASMKLDWCCYELGRFHANENGKTICIINTHLNDPPSQLAEWQAYRADKTGLRKFFVDLFYKGQFTDNVALNERLQEDQFVVRLKDAIEDLEAEFAAFRVQEHYFPYRITVASPNEGQLPSKLSFSTANVTGDPRALNVFGVEQGVDWGTFKEHCISTFGATWPQELERFSGTTSGRLLPKSLSPFKSPNGGHFIPVISRIESFEDKRPWRVNLIFVELDPAVRIEASEPSHMPDNWSRLLALLSVSLRFRWEGIEPALSELRNGRTDRQGPDAWKAVMRKVLDLAAGAENRARLVGFSNAGQFFTVFDQDLRRRLQDQLKPYPEAMQGLSAAVDGDDRAKAAECLELLRGTNSRFMLAGLEQFQRFISGLEPEG